jgi:hypothetical protein
MERAMVHFDNLRWRALVVIQLTSGVVTNSSEKSSAREPHVARFDRTLLMNLVCASVPAAIRVCMSEITRSARERVETAGQKNTQPQETVRGCDP